MKRLRAVLLQAVIAAAFIGPGTVTTAASAGAAHGATLLWALLFSTLACFLLQDAAAGLAIRRGEGLGRTLSAGRSPTARWAARLLVGGAVLLGCAAYQAGNLLGAVAGMQLLLPDLSAGTVAGPLAALAGLILLVGSPDRVARVLGAAVGVMGLAFLGVAAGVGLPDGAAAGLVLPRVPAGATALALGLVGTTVVPYNLFLGSGLAARGEDDAGLARFGLAVAVGGGGLISMAILAVGTTLDGSFSFPALADRLAADIGPWARQGFACGLLAAGLSSAVTAPLAAALTARSLFAAAETAPEWEHSGGRFRGVWLAVLGAGALFAVSGLKPVPAIVAAQALNGLLLPVVALFLWDAVRRGGGKTWALGGVVVLTVWLGTVGLTRAAATAFGVAVPEGVRLGISLAGTLAAAGWMLTRRKSLH